MSCTSTEADQGKQNLLKIAIALVIILGAWWIWNSFADANNHHIPGYTFKYDEQYRTDTNFYLNQAIQKPDFGRLVPALPFALLGEINGGFFWVIISFLGISILLELLSKQTLGKQVSPKESFLLQSFTALLLLHMFLQGYYSQIAATLFVLAFLAIRNWKWQIPLLALIAMSHPRGMFIILLALGIELMIQRKISIPTIVHKFSIALGALLAFMTPTIGPLLTYTMFLFPKTVLFAAYSGYVKLKERSIKISTWILASILFSFIDINGRTLLLAAFLTAPVILLSYNMMTKLQQKAFFVVYTIEFIQISLWIWSFYATRFV